MGQDFSLLLIRQSQLSSDSCSFVFEMMFIRDTSQQREDLQLLNIQNTYTLRKEQGQFSQLQEHSLGKLS